MQDEVTIWYRGAHYQLGRGHGGYGLWAAATPPSAPLELWPETSQGWSDAWSRFTALEHPAAIVHLSPPTAPAVAPPTAASATSPTVPAVVPTWASAGPAGAPAAAPGTGPAVIPGSPGRAAGAAVLLAVGVACGIAGLFPAYLSGPSLAAQPPELVTHAIYLAAWAVSGALIFSGGARSRTGALVGLGTSIVAFGFFLADLGSVVAGGTHLLGAGLILSLAGWLASTAGAAIALWPGLAGAPGWSQAGSPGWSQAGSPGWPNGGAPGWSQEGWAPGWRRGGARRSPVLLAVTALVAAGVAAAFAPSWDSYTLRTPAGIAQTITAGNVFSDPGVVIAGNVIVMLAIVAVAAAAALWRPARHGAALLAGGLVPMAAQAISALIQVGQGAAPAQFGISANQASQAGLTISAGLTAAFWIYLVLVVVLAGICAWLAAASRPRRPAGSAGPAGTGTVAASVASVPWQAR